MVPKRLGVVADTYDLITQVEEQDSTHKLDASLGYIVRWGESGEIIASKSFQKQTTWTTEMCHLPSCAFPAQHRS